MRLLVCDDHRPTLEALSLALTDNGHTVVATATDPDAAVAAALEYQPDACVLEMNFRHDSGLGAIARIHEVSADTKVVMLSGSISPGLVADAIAQGAQGFVSKEKPVAVIVEALEMAHQGDVAVDPIFGHDELPTHAISGDLVNAAELLTDREWDLLRCLMDGLSSAQAAAEPETPRAGAGTRLLKLLNGVVEGQRVQVSGFLKADS